MRIRWGLVCLLLGGLPIRAQQISLDVGANIGVPITRAVEPFRGPFGEAVTTTHRGPRLSGGPGLTLFAEDRVAVDVDIIFRPIRYDTQSEEPCCTRLDAIRATSLEIPVFASYHAGHRRVRPYAGAGLVVYDKQWGRIDAHNTIHDRGNLQTHVVFSYPRISGASSPPPFVFGGGVDYPKGRFLVRPEIRYTRWRGRRPNQWDLFVRITLSSFRFGNKRAGP